MRGSIAASPNGGSFPIQTTLELQGSFTLDKVPADPTTITLILTPLLLHSALLTLTSPPLLFSSPYPILLLATSRSVFWVVPFDCGEGEPTGRYLASYFLDFRRCGGCPHFFSWKSAQF